MNRPSDESRIPPAPPIRPTRKPEEFLPPLPPTQPRDPNAPSLVDAILEVGAQVPDEVWAKFPRDGSINLDHYLYGAPKVDE